VALAAAALTGLICLLLGLLLPLLLQHTAERERAEILDRHAGVLAAALEGADSAAARMVCTPPHPDPDRAHVVLLTAAGVYICGDTALVSTDAPEVLKALRAGRASGRYMDGTGRIILSEARRVPAGGGSPAANGVVLVAAPLELQGQGFVLGVFAATAGVLVLLAAGVAYRTAGRMSRPLVRMAEAARNITSGSLGERVEAGTADERGDLARALNDMAGKLSNDIERLKKLERVRSEFLGNVSHELRTPIFSIQGFLETLLDGAVDDPAVNREFLEKAYAHADRLNVLLNDLIDISRIESGEMKMSFRYFPAAGFVRQMATEMTSEADRKGIRLDVAVEADEDLEIYGDRERLRQVMVNLIDNAVKYTEAGGAVTVRVKPVRNRCAISVEDTGCGIAQEHLTRIFERFYRVDRDRSRTVGGTGLGLAIVKHIVEAHGGTITAESEVGKGSVFTFTLKR
jgi:two-component system phosphate regulon sensor histidine kinase PhoR